MVAKKFSVDDIPSSPSLGEELLRHRRCRRLKGFGEGLSGLSSGMQRRTGQTAGGVDDPEGSTDKLPSSAASGTTFSPALVSEAADCGGGYGPETGIASIEGDSTLRKRGGGKEFFVLRRRWNLCRKLVVFAVGLLAVIGIVFYRNMTAAEPQPLLETTMMATPSARFDGAAEEASQEQKIMLHITGAVKNPGMFEVVSGMRIGEVIQIAGGHTPDAFLESVNLAMVVQDGTKIHIPRIGEESSEAAVHEESSGGGQKININTASEAELLTLPRIGSSTAARIIEHRTKNGRFKSAEDLVQVSGIGPKTLENLLPLITV